jgi:hypothetical protein
MFPNFLSKLLHNFYHGKSSQNWWATLLIFNELPKEKNRPLGENSMNLVTLVLAYKSL